MDKLTDYIILPSGTRVRKDDIVVLSTFPDSAWIVRLGEFEYQGSKQEGWYIESVDDGNCIPLSIDQFLGMMDLTPMPVVEKLDPPQ